MFRVAYYLALGKDGVCSIERVLVDADKPANECGLEGELADFKSWLFQDAPKPKVRRKTKVITHYRTVNPTSFVPSHCCQCLRDDGLRFRLDFSEEIVADLKSIFMVVDLPNELVEHVGDLIP